MEEFLAPRSDEHPSGDNLEYDPLFTALELAAQPGEERQAGEEFLPAEEPEWRAVIARAEAVLERSHDLRAAVFLAHALLRYEGVEGFARVTGYVRGLLTDWWDTCHPQLDADDDNDPTMRVNAVLGLAGSETVQAALRLAPLSDSATFGRMSLRDIQIAEGEISAPESMARPPEPQTVAAAFRDTRADALAGRLAAVRRAIDDIVQINAVFDERTPGQGPELGPLLRMLRRIAGILSGVIGEPEGGSDAATGADALAAAPEASGAAPGTIASQKDVLSAIDRIIDYYETREPSSPVPVLMRRARRLVGADFLAIVRDMAPDGFDNVRRVGGIEDDDYG